MLVSANLQNTEAMAKFSDVCFFVTCKVKKSNWMSGTSEVSGLAPTWKQQIVRVEYKEPTNLMLVFFKSQHQSELTICEAFVEVGAFLDPAKNQITVPLLRDNTAVGEVKFEMIGKNADNHGTYIVDSKHPHVLSGCKVCDQTHKGPSGTAYSCHYCVCVRCNGSGVKIQDHAPCTKIKTM